jgi:hypothetical protein
VLFVRRAVSLRLRPMLTLIVVLVVIALLIDAAAADGGFALARYVRSGREARWKHGSPTCRDASLDWRPVLAHIILAASSRGLATTPG